MAALKPTLEIETIDITVSVSTLSDDDAYPIRSPTSTLSSSTEKCAVSVASLKENLPGMGYAGVDVHSDSKLPGKDSGFAAWRMMLLAVLAEAPLLGFPLSFGIFQSHYNNQFPGNTSSPWIGVLANGIYFLAAPLMTHLCQKFEFKRQYYIFIGWAMCVASMLASAFCPFLPGLVMLQGGLYGTGLLLIEMPLLMILNTWFDKRRGLAYGILFGASDVFGFAWAFLEESLLHRSGYKITVLVMTLLIFGLCGPAIFFLRERPSEQVVERRGSVISQADLPFTPSTTPPHTTSFTNKPRKYYKRSIFYIIAAVNLFHALACELPFIYLPSSGLDLGFSAKQGTIILAVGILSQVVGELGFGELSDRVTVSGLMVITTAGASLVTFCLWGLARSFALLIIYALTFGCFMSGFLALWARLGMLFGEEDAAMVYSMLCTGRGVGVIASGPISSLMISQWRVHRGTTFSSFGSGQYTGVIILVGASMAVAALLGVVGVIALWWKSGSQLKSSDVMKKIKDDLES